MRSLHIALKDVKVWTRDIAALAVLLGMPIVLIFILGSALGGAGQGSKIPVAVENLDRGVTVPASGQPTSSSFGVTRRFGDDLVDAFQDSERLNDVFDIGYKPLGVENQLVEVANGSIAAVLVIPEDFSEKVQAGKPVALELHTDPGAEMSAGIFEGVVRSFAAHYSAASVAVQTAFASAQKRDPGVMMHPDGQAGLQQAAVKAVDEGPEPIEIVDAEAEGGMQMTALDFYAVSMTSMFLMFGAMFGAFSTIKERREQTLSRLLSTPTGATSVTGGKMLGIFGLGMLQFTVLFLATRYLFRVNWGENVGAIFLVAAAEMLAVTGLAVLIASLAKTERGAGGLGPLLIQIQALIGGAFFTITILPEWLQPIRFASIVGWALEGWQEIQLRGGGLAEVVTPVAALLGFATVFFVAGAALTGVRR